MICASNWPKSSNQSNKKHRMSLTKLLLHMNRGKYCYLFKCRVKANTNFALSFPTQFISICQCEHFNTILHKQFSYRCRIGVNTPLGATKVRYWVTRKSTEFIQFVTAFFCGNKVVKIGMKVSIDWCRLLILVPKWEHETWICCCFSRDEAQNKMAVLQEKNEKDIINHETEMKDLRRKIDHDDKIKEFMLIKADDRAELKAEEAAKKEAMRGKQGNNKYWIKIRIMFLTVRMWNTLFFFQMVKRSTQSWPWYNNTRMHLPESKKSREKKTLRQLCKTLWRTKQRTLRCLIMLMN